MLMFELCKIDVKLAFGFYENSVKSSFGLCKNSAKLAFGLYGNSAKLSFGLCKILQKHCRVATGLVKMLHRSGLCKWCRIVSGFRDVESY